ncbi:MAG: MBL fold metallo-hydrolase [Myxococcales bacterium]|nr:MBL fold metallo-hydrolase [Myxococcales bacterium]
MQVTMIGHATLLIESDRVRLLTDPWLTDPIFGGLVRHTPPLVHGPADLQDVDLIAITHDHEDHFDARTLRRLPKTVPILVPRTPVTRMADRARALGFLDVIELAPWEIHEQGDMRVTCTPSPRGFEHCTWLVETPRARLFDGGDMLEDEDFVKRLAAHGPIDIAFLPISGFRFPHMPRGVMGSKEAAWAASVLQPGLAVPSAYQMEWFTDEHRHKNAALMPGRPEEFLRFLEDLTPDVPGRIMIPGDRWTAP